MRAACSGFGFDQVGDGLGLGQVQLVVEEGALAEFARPRLAGAQFKTTLHQQVEHHRATVALQFEHVFAGEGVRPGEIQRQAFIDHLSAAIEERAVVCVPGLQFAAADFDGDPPGQRPGDPDDTHATPALGGSDGGDGFGSGLHVDISG